VHIKDSFHTVHILAIYYITDSFTYNVSKNLNLNLTHTKKCVFKKFAKLNLTVGMCIAFV